MVLKHQELQRARRLFIKGALVGITIATIISGLQLILFCYYVIQGKMFIHQLEFCRSHIYETYWGFCVKRRCARNEQDTFSWNKVAHKSLSAALCLWVFLSISRVLERRSAVKARS